VRRERDNAGKARLGEHAMNDDGTRAEPAAYAGTAMPKKELSYLSTPDGTATARVPEMRDEIVRPAYLAHIVLLTNRLDEMRQWWRTVLGGAPMMSGKELEFITFDDEHHRVAIFQRDQLREKGPEIDTAGLHHVAFTYASLGDLVATYQRLKRAGITPIRVIHHGITVSTYYLDPDNNRVELQINAFPNNQALNAWLAGRHFNNNPIGVLFNFEDLIARYEAGEDPWQISSPALMDFAAPADAR
jgi:catechol 2,3-dioxygenase-like lactoylglutathione lyase family enzyme